MSKVDFPTIGDIEIYKGEFDPIASIKNKICGFVKKLNKGIIIVLGFNLSPIMPVNLKMIKLLVKKRQVFSGDPEIFVTQRIGPKGSLITVANFADGTKLTKINVLDYSSKKSKEIEILIEAHRTKLYWLDEQLHPEPSLTKLISRRLRLSQRTAKKIPIPNYVNRKPSWMRYVPFIGKPKERAVEKESVEKLEDELEDLMAENLEEEQTEEELTQQLDEL
jgi:hypothetical protein